MKVYLDLFDFHKTKKKPKRISIVKMLRRRRLVFEQKDGQRIEVQVTEHAQEEEVLRITAIDGYLELRPSSSNVIQLRSVKF